MSSSRRAGSGAAPLSHLVHGSATVRQLQQLTHEADTVIDARGSFCPEPVIRTQDRVRLLRPGQTAMLLADDAGVEVDIPAWCLSTGNEFLGTIREARFYRVFVRKGQPPVSRSGT